MTDEKEQPLRVGMVCEHTGSPDVSRDAEARWDIEKQDWTLAVVLDQAYSEEGDTSLASVPAVFVEGTADDIYQWLIDDYVPHEWSGDEQILLMKVLVWRTKEAVK